KSFRKLGDSKQFLELLKFEVIKDNDGKTVYILLHSFKMLLHTLYLINLFSVIRMITTCHILPYKGSHAHIMTPPPHFHNLHGWDACYELSVPEYELSNYHLNRHGF
uniref:Uncharacterized protein n=1 Tax=Romanomermis culicivorax TaxID=13658 RepID=A0A915JXL9_ROMCU